jgi:hypothetical protein
MKNSKELFNRILNESIQSKADELTEKIMQKVETNEDIDTFELEVGQEYDYKKSDDYKSKRVVYKGKVPHGGKFENNDGEKIILSNKLINKMIRKINETQLEKEIGEGNKFTGELAKAKKAGKTSFEVDGKTYKVEANEDLGGMEDSHPAFGGMNLMNPSDEDKETLEKYLRRYIKRDHGVEDEDDFGFETLEESVTYRVAISENHTVDLTENELVDIIESIVTEEQITNNVKGGKAKGLVAYDKVHKQDSQVNSNALKDVEKKMKEYVKAGSKGNFEMNPKHFPKGNGELGEMSKKAYRASDAVEEYIENFAYSPGMENLKYDEIEPNDEWLSMNIEGSEKTGNSGKYANAVETDLGKKINKKRKENLYQKEVDRSYKRVKQPVDTAGEDKKEGKLDKMFSKLGESENEKTNLINEEMSKMKNLITYNQKTQ